MQTKITRRAALTGAAALPLVAIGGRAQAAKITLRLATGQAPSHPVNIRANEVIARLAKETGGALEIKLFPNNQLGSDPDLISQVRSGGVDLINMASSVLATLVPAAAITNLGFAFSGYPEVWKAMDGALGKSIAGEISKRGVTQIGRAWDNGFRQITSSKKPILSPADLKGFKIRVPPAPMLTSLFQALGAAPSP
ncbi:MAG: TRAP transporter substrate-binding protein, partial [Rhodospirillales bacterium]|nr:TRAP transporter substrate-binding protein [Rhodospirillales bacterium]